MEEAGKDGGSGKTRPLSRGSSEVGVCGAQLSIEKEEGQNCHRFVSKLYHHQVDGLFLFM